MKVRLRLLAVIVILSALIVRVTLLSRRPPLVLKRSPGSVTIDVQTLGEYLTPISRLKLSEGPTTVWEIRTSSGTPEIWRVVLNLGLNPSSPPRAEFGSYRVVVPATADSFELRANARYTVEVWGPSGPRHRASFLLSARKNG